MDEECLSRKDRLAIWRARKGGGADKSAKGRAAEPKAKESGGLSARPGAGNVVKMPASRASKDNSKRKPFQVDMRVVQEASERRVAPGTPIHSLKKRLKRADAQKKVAGHHAAQQPKTRVGASAGAGSSAMPSSRALAKGKAEATRVSGHVGGVRRSLDAARTKEVSEYLKSQISEANMLLEISGVDAARTLLADLLSVTDAARGVGELALYWAARAKLEEDACIYGAARRTLDEGQAYISMPTQQKVMEKVVAAFEARMNNRAEQDVAQLLENSIDSLSSSASHGNSNSSSNSPTSSTPFRYDPNDLSTEDDSGDAQSAIKNLSFSKIGTTEGGGDSGSKESGSASAPSTGSSVQEPLYVLGSSSGGGSGGGIESMSGVIFSDDDSDLSVSDIDEAVIARAKAFNDEEDARKACIEAGVDLSDAADLEEPTGLPEGMTNAGNVRLEDPAPVPDDHAERVSRREVESMPAPEKVAPPAAMAKSSMAPPPARESKRRKGSPYPKPRKDTPTRSSRFDATGEDGSPGSFIAQVESKGKDGKRTLTPVRRSRRLSAGSKEPTPSPLRKEMEAML